MVSLADAACARMSELTRLLAGLATLAPAEVMPMVKTLNPSDLTDEHARQFLQALAGGEWTRKSAIDMCLSLGYWEDYIKWQELVNLSGDGFEYIAARTVEAIKRLHITLLTIQDLAHYASTLEKGRKWTAANI